MKKGLGLLVVSLLALPMSANALTGSVDIECTKNELKVNESTTCTIKGKSDAEVTGLSMKISSNLELGEVVVDKNVWQGDGSDGFITLYTDTNKKGDFVVGTFTVTSKTAGTNDVVLDEIIFSDKDFNEVKLATVKEAVTFAADTPAVDDKEDTTIDSDKKDDEVTNSEKEESNNNESVVENPDTGVVVSLGMLGLVFIGTIVCIFTKRKNYFCKL